MGHAADLIDMGVLEAWSEKLEGAGEDALPLAFPLDDRKAGCAAVFDGLGGAGSSKWETELGIETGARIAARLGRETLKRFIQEQIAQRDAVHCDPSGQSNVIERLALNYQSNSLQSLFDNEFSRLAIKLQAGAETKLKSKMLRTIPTTFASFCFWPKGTGFTSRVLWSGDSRVYFLSAGGLSLLTSDHLKANALGEVAAGGDAPLMYYISELTLNFIQQAEYIIDDPGFLICATDGAFAYFKSDIHFEYVVWQGILHDFKSTLASDYLTNEIRRITKDDSSLVLFPIGRWSDEYADLIRGRVNFLENKISRFDEINNMIQECESGLREGLELREIFIKEAAATSLLQQECGYISRGDADESR